MKRCFIKLLGINMLIFGFISCHTNESNKGSGADTAMKTTADTAIIPGTPGPTGSAPKPGDTTRAHNDSLNKARHISDSSLRPATAP